ncbi:MAG TPA: AAA family ATPase [Pirellulales bacterium]|nr:AAA family ATPase [Pirellulales bacterium]
MPDQANHLRQMMRGARRAAISGAAERPGLLVVAGGKGGVGTTTLAVNLAVALARRGRRTLVVDGDLGKADTAALCGTRQGYTVGDVLAGRRSIQEAMQDGPAGIRVLPGAWATGHVTDCSATAQERLVADLARLERFDHVVIDAGSGVTRIVERFWRAADRVLLVTTTASTSVIDAYAALKTFGGGRQGPMAQVVMNMADGRQAQGAMSRLRDACRRFLGLELDCAASLAHCREIAEAAQRQMPVVLSSPASQAAQIIDRLAESVEQSTGDRKDEVLPERVASGPFGVGIVQAEDGQPGEEIRRSIQATHV